MDDSKHVLDEAMSHIARAKLSRLLSDDDLDRRERSWLEVIELALCGLMSGSVNPREVVDAVRGNDETRMVRAVDSVYAAAISLAELETGSSKHVVEMSRRRVEQMIWELARLCDPAFARLEVDSTLQLVKRVEVEPVLRADGKPKGGAGKLQSPGCAGKLAHAVGAFGYDETTTEGDAMANFRKVASSVRGRTTEP